jgi:hypothetical protein
MDISVPTHEEHPRVNSAVHYLGRNTTGAAWEGYGPLNAEHTRLVMDSTLLLQEECQYGNPESHYLGRSLSVPSQRGYKHLSCEHGDFGRDMRIQSDKEYRHYNSEHAEFGRGVTLTSEERHQLFNPDHTGIGISVTLSSQEGYEHVNPEHTIPELSVTVPSQDANQYLSILHTRPGMSGTVPSQDANQYLSLLHTRPELRVTVLSQDRSRYLNFEHTRPGVSVTVPSMERDKKENTDRCELDIAVETDQADVHPTEGPDTLPPEYTKFLFEEKLYKDTWRHRNVRSGLDLYKMFTMCHENEVVCMFGQESHVAYSLPPVQISPVVVVCPLRMHPSFLCSWLGFLNDREKHLTAVHRDCLVKGKCVELKVDDFALLSVFNEFFLCYTLLETNTLYCVVKHACYYKACNSEFRYVTEATDAFTGITVTKTAAVATTFQTFAFLKDTHKCVSYCGVDEDQLVKFAVYFPSEN